MKKIVLPLLLLGLLSGSAQAQNKKGAPAPKSETAATGSLAIGSPMPLDGLMMRSVDGRPVSLREAKTDKGLLVMFSCNTCPFVIKAEPRTQEAMAVATKLGIGMVIVNSNEGQRDSLDAPKAMVEYATRQHYTVPYVIDELSQIANAFGATRTPEVFLFNGEGLLVYKGALEDNPADPSKSKKTYVADALKALDQKKPITPTETKSIGCSIKRRDS